jgi:hypothetical protein
MRCSLAVCAALTFAVPGCAAVRPPIQTQATLGKVVVYRNGVAYFERRATVTDGELRLTIPVDRVDDLLKSLQIVDAHTGESLPVSADETDMVIAVPGKGPRDLLVSYVTDSPAWKPTYRLVLDKTSGSGQMEAWAVVDNVSGEDWKRVTIGVGSTSALSFRYDLHSVRLVERETLDNDSEHAQAPPLGGSPYAVASMEVPVIAGLGGSLVDHLLSAADEPSTVRVEQNSLRAKRSGHGEGMAGVGTSAPASSQDSAFDALAEQVRMQPGKVTLQGFARGTDKHRKDAAQQRVDAVRDQLIARGVPAEKLKAIGTDAVNEAHTIRILAEAAVHTATQAQGSVEEAGAPIGNAYFLAGVPMTIEKDRSAMVSLLKKAAKMDRVYYYDPVSARGSQHYAFQAVRIENPSEYTLDRGPFSVYSEGQFLGEGLSEAIPPKSTGFVPFALDRQLIVEPKNTDREEVSGLHAIEHGVVSAEVQQIHATVLSVHNRGDKEAQVYVRHAIADGWTLRPTGAAVERMGDDYLFMLRVSAGASAELQIEVSRPVQQALDLRTQVGAAALVAYLKRAQDVTPALRAQLEEVLGLYREMADAEQRIATLGDQMNEYRNRVDELNQQLLTLRRVRSAQDLSHHLAQKMREMSERLQVATIRTADLQEQLLTRRIRVQDCLADLSLRHEDVAGSLARL